MRSHYKTRRWVAAAVASTAALALLPLLPAAAAERVGTSPRYRYIELGTLGGAGGYGVPAATNGRGVVVGTSNGHGVQWKGGLSTDLGDGLAGPGGQSDAQAVNLSGVVAGQSHIDQESPPHAVTWTNGVLADLGTGYGAGSGSSAYGVNDGGMAVGVHFAQQSGPYRAAAWLNGKVIDLGTLGGTSSSPYSTVSEARAVNNAGQVVGSALPISGYPLHGFIWQDSVMRDLGTLGGDGEATVASAINSQGVAAGFSQVRNGETHGFRWRNGTMKDLGVLGPAFPYRASFAAGINDAGVVVGGARVIGGTYGHLVAAVWRNGTITDLNTLVRLPAGRRLTSAVDIDNTGTIVVQSCEITHCDNDGSTDRAVVLRPIR